MGARIGFAIMVIVVLGVALYAYQSGSFSLLGKGTATSTATSAATSAGTSTAAGAGNSLSAFFQSLMPHYVHPTSTSPSRTSPTPVPPATRATSTISNPVTSSVSTTINPASIPPGFTASQLSPYFHQIRFGGVSSQSISLNAYLGSKTPTSTTIDVTGWQIKPNQGGEYLPQAVNVYDPSGLTAATDIRLKSGDTLNIYPTSAPVNLRLNACVGYLRNTNQFKPALPQNCPSVNRSLYQMFSGACQNYIQSLGGCRAPNMADPRIPVNEYACRDYLSSHFNYRSCYDEHRTDANFLSREVRVWMGKSPMDPSHDRISLLDQNGLLVDYYSF